MKKQLADLKRTKYGSEAAVERVRMRLRGTILSEADVVASTLSSSGKQQFLDHILEQELSFDIAIIGTPLLPSVTCSL